MNKPFAARTPDDLLSREEIAGMSGREFMEGILAGRIAGAAIAGQLNFSVDSVGDGEVRFRGAPLFEHSNPLGVVHGGWYGTVLDSAMACAVITTLPAGVGQTTLEYKVNIIRPVPLATEVLAIGRVQHAGRSTAVAVGEIRGAQDNRLYATGSTTCIILRREQPRPAGA